MEFNDFLQLINRKKQTILTLVLVGTMMIILVSLINPLKYGVTSRLLVTQNSSESDVYSLSRSNEYLGTLLSEVVYSGSFYDKVLNSNYNIDRNYFSSDYGKQLKKWQKTINTSTKDDTGIIKIDIYHPQVTEAKKIALAVNDILINNNQEYHGGENIKINVIDQPLASEYPVKPNLLYNGLSAMAIFFLISLFYIYTLPEEKYSLYLFGKSDSAYKNKKKSEKENKVVINGKKKNIVDDEDRQSENEKKSETSKSEENKNEKKDIKGKEADEVDLSGNIANIIR